MPPVLAFSGFSKSGKTTLLAKVVSILSKKGLRIGVVKHHGHLGRTEGPSRKKTKDTDLFLEAGAAAAVLTGPGVRKEFRSQTGDPGPLAAAAGLMGMDLILAEGFKGRPGLFKIEVYGPGRAPSLVTDPYLLAVAGAGEEDPSPGGVRWFDRDDAPAVAGLVTDCFLPEGRRGAVPDREACFALMARHAMLPNIILHSLVVADAACRLASALVRAGRSLDLPLVEAGAILHDIAKTECLGLEVNHAELGGRIIRSLGYEGTAEVVEAHVDPAAALRSGGLWSPSMIVNYADKRVLHDRVVSFAERGEDLIKRYGRTPEKVRRLEKLIEIVRGIETDLFEGLDLKPDDLEEINQAPA